MGSEMCIRDSNKYHAKTGPRTIAHANLETNVFPDSPNTLMYASSSCSLFIFFLILSHIYRHIFLYVNRYYMSLDINNNGYFLDPYLNISFFRSFLKHKDVKQLERP